MLDPFNVCIVLVTRGDVDLQPILLTVPPEYQVVIWNNAERPYDAGVWGRYAALGEVARPVVVFQDDDCLVDHDALRAHYEPGTVVGVGWGVERMRRYHDTTLLGWGAICDRHLPWQAFQRYALHHPMEELMGADRGLGAEIVFPMLNRTKTVMGPEPHWLEQDGQPVYRRNNRMWLQDGFNDRVGYWLERARKVRDA